MYTRICTECTRVYKVILLLEDDILKCLPCRIIEFTKSEHFEIYTDFQKGHFFTKIKELYSEPSYNELKTVLEKYLDPDNAVITPAREAEAPKPVTTAAAAPKENVKNAVDAFDELFND